MTFLKLVGKAYFLEIFFEEMHRLGSFEEPKGTRYIQENACFVIIIFSFRLQNPVSDFF